MRKLLAVVFLLSFVFANAQHQFEHIELELNLLPKSEKQENCNQNILNVIETVDQNYRTIADTLYKYKSLKHTIFETVLIETDNGFFNPLDCGETLKTSNIILFNESLNLKIDAFEKKLNEIEKFEFYKFLIHNYDHFSIQDKTIDNQPVRIKSIKFPSETIATVGIDIYGAHFLWTINKINWNVIKVEKLWVY